MAVIKRMAPRLPGISGETGKHTETSTGSGTDMVCTSAT